jgi:P-type E1-E2 ATPase
MRVEIPGYGKLDLRYLVLDYNGTVALDGILKSEIRPLLERLSGDMQIHLVTSDTFGTASREMEGTGAVVNLLEGDDHTGLKRELVESLGAEHTVAIGNGANDSAMLESASLSIAIVGEEGCSMASLSVADIAVTSITHALELLLNPRRLVATLRR